MSWTLVVWSMLVATSLTLALIHVFIWYRRPQKWAHLSFSVFATAVAAVTVMELMAMHASSVSQISLILRWAHLPILVFFVAITCFVRCFFMAGRLSLALTACALQTLTLVLGFTTGSNQFFSEITGLKHITILGGETISIPEGILNPWYLTGPLSILVLIAFVFDASISMWKRGTTTDRRRAIMISSGIVFFLIIAPAHAALVNLGLIASPYLVGLSFMPTVIAMSFELSNEVLLAAQLAHRLQVSEAALRISEQRMSLAAEAAELGLWEWDIARDEIWSTDKGRALFGITDPELEHKHLGIEYFLNTLHTDDREAVREAIQKALHNTGHYESEYRVVLPTGELRWFTARGRVDSISGTPRHMYGIVLDITQRKQTELEAERQRNELAHLSRVTLLGELSGSLAHELNQPLAAILSNAQAAQHFLTQGAAGVSEVRDILNDIVEEDKRAGEVIHRLHLLLKKGEVRHQPLNINDAVQHVLKLIRGDLLHQHIAVSLHLASKLPKVNGDTVQIQQVLLNLLMNGCEAMADTKPNGRRLTIRSVHAGGKMQISISDQGRGIVTENLQRIFEPFFTTKAHGMGMGLAICRSIIIAHGGNLWAEHNRGRGTVFHFTLPATGSNAPEERFSLQRDRSDNAAT